MLTELEQLILFQLEQIMFLLGYHFILFQKFVGMRYGQDGVDYYAEIHTSFWNSMIHTIFMPVTMYGFFISIPGTLRLSPPQAVYARRFSMLFYLGIYARISIICSVLFVSIYSIPFVYSHTLYKILARSMHWQKITMFGLAISTAALFIQETVGHAMGGDMPSRFEGVPNAIIYAPYYSVSHLLASA